MVREAVTVRSAIKCLGFRGEMTVIRVEWAGCSEPARCGSLVDTASGRCGRWMNAAGSGNDMAKGSENCEYDLSIGRSANSPWRKPSATRCLPRLCYRRVFVASLRFNLHFVFGRLNGLCAVLRTPCGRLRGAAPIPGALAHGKVIAMTDGDRTSN